MLIIDRFEGEFAIVETDSGMVNIPITELPKNAKEGNVLKLSIDKDSTAQRKKHIKNLMNEVFKK